jgi:hypothetical protein
VVKNICMILTAPQPNFRETSVPLSCAARRLAHSSPSTTYHPARSSKMEGCVQTVLSAFIALTSLAAIQRRGGDTVSVNNGSGNHLTLKQVRRKLRAICADRAPQFPN